MRAWKRRSCSSSETESQYLIEDQAGAHQQLLEARGRAHEVLVLRVGAEAHHPLDAGAVVPAAVEQDHLPRRRQVGDVALEVPLGLLALGRGAEGDRAHDPRVGPLADPLDHAALAGGVAPLEEDGDPQPGVDDPFLQLDQLGLQALQLLLVLLLGDDRWESRWTSAWPRSTIALSALMTTASIFTDFWVNLEEHNEQGLFLVLVGFILSFAFIRMSTRIIRSESVSWWPGNIESDSGVHLHHLVFGIVTMMVSGMLIGSRLRLHPVDRDRLARLRRRRRPDDRRVRLWVHLDDVYWAEEGRSSIDATVIAAAAMMLIAGRGEPAGDRDRLRLGA